MSHFDTAIETVLAHEGGFVNNPNDPGGATNYGVSLRFLKLEGVLLDLDGDGDMDADDIRQMPRTQAVTFYRTCFWERYNYDRIADLDLATKVFDLCVVSGSNQAHKFLQRALRANGFALSDDGDFGPLTAKAVSVTPAFPVLTAMRSEAAGFFRLLVNMKPTLAEFQAGWLKRAYS